MRIREAALACTVFLAAVTVSSAAEPAKKADAPPAAPNSQMSQRLEMAEDLEIMGAVLQAALRQSYEQPGYRGVRRIERVAKEQRVNKDGKVETVERVVPELRSVGETAAATAVKRPEGAYLDGYGVVYQVTLDVPPPERRPSKDTAEDGDGGELGPVQIEMLEGTDVLVIRGQKADVDRAMKIIAKEKWKDAARRLRGDPLEKPPVNVAEGPRTPTADDLADELLDVLAENAGNFRHLKPQDRLSVAITFPRSKAPEKPAYRLTDRFNIGPATLTMRTPVAIAWQGDLPAYGDSLPEGRSSHEVSGDLHLRQKNYRKAIEAYQKALAQMPVSPQIHIKLAQVHLALGNLKEAQKLIERACKLAPGSVKPQSNVPKPPPSKIPLPARLTVSVAKSRLDEVAAGKMKPEELKGHATVDYFNPPADRPGLGSQRTGPSMGSGEGMEFDYWLYDALGQQDVEYDGRAPGPSRSRGQQRPNY